MCLSMYMFFSFSSKNYIDFSSAMVEISISGERSHLLEEFESTRWIYVQMQFKLDGVCVCVCILSGAWHQVTSDL